MNWDKQQMNTELLHCFIHSFMFISVVMTFDVLFSVPMNTDVAPSPVNQDHYKHRYLIISTLYC